MIVLAEWGLAEWTGLAGAVTAIATTLLAARERLGRIRAEEAKEKTASDLEAVKVKKAQADVQKQEAETEQERITFLFGRYDAVINRVEAEHTKDRDILASLQKEHTACQEKVAALSERVYQLEQKSRP